MEDTIWPSVEYTERRWGSEAELVDPLWSKRRRRRNTGTYRQAVVPEIAERPVVLSRELTSDAQNTAGDIARFDAQYKGGAPFAAVLLRSESAASSQIENLTANARRIALAVLGDKSRPNAALIARNTSALQAALQLSDELDVAAILSMHNTLMEESGPDQSGRIRDQIVWIGGDSPVTSLFVPPRHQDVPDALNDLEVFMQRTDLAPLVLAAVAHAQFETIHPFTDGNGRTGRALVSAILNARGLTRNFTVPVSSGLLGNTEEYFSALDAYRQGRIEPIVEQFLLASRQAMANAQRLLVDLNEAQDEILATAQRTTKNLTVFAAFCIAEPAFTADMVAQLGIPKASAYRLIDKLEQQKLLRREPKIRGQSVWSVPALTRALDAFARRAARRTAG